ncbi:hypothetical protein D3C83_75770 [compost metagenome]
MVTICGVAAPASVSTPSVALPSLKTNCAGSRASCGTGYGRTSMSPMAKGVWLSMMVISATTARSPSSAVSVP